MPQQAKPAQELRPQSSQHDVDHGANRSVELPSRRILAEVSQLEEQLRDRPAESMNHMVCVELPEGPLVLSSADIGYHCVPGFIPCLENRLVPLRSFQQGEGSQSEDRAWPVTQAEFESMTSGGVEHPTVVLLPHRLEQILVLTQRMLDGR